MSDWLQKANESCERGETFIIATIIRSSGSTPREAGAKMLIFGDGSFHGTIGGGALEKSVLESAHEFFKSQESKTLKYSLTLEEGHLCGGELEVFFELVGNSPALYIFGAGHVGQALCHVMIETPFKVHLIDDREEWVLSPNLPKGIIKHHQTWNDFIKKNSWSSEKTYIAIMTPGHALDEVILQTVLKHDFKYLGLMGSKNKWTEIKSNLLKNGFSHGDIAKVNCPIGLSIGGKSPKEIAISIAAELTEKYNAR